MKKPTLVRIGGPAYRTSKKCEICKRDFTKVPFGHHFKTSWGAIDVCILCTEDLYATVMADLAGGIFSLKRDVDEIRYALNSLSGSRKWRAILKEAKTSKKRRK